VINAGVTGYGPIEQYAQLKKFIDTLQPDIVINQFFVNEYSDINDNPENKRKGIGFNSGLILRTKN
jgi:dTDP-4-dehydrorhamnose reductase